MRHIRSCIGILLLVAGSEPAQGAKPEYTTIVCPNAEQMAGGLARWESRHPKRIRVIRFGKSGQGRDLLMCAVTDYSVPAEDKQIVLLTSTHVATERNSCTGLLRLTKWLIGDSAEAAEIRKKQLVLIMPNNNPDACAGDGGSDVYLAWTLDDVRDPETHPEAVALRKVMDRYRPEVHVDVHGVSFSEQTMWESTGIGWAGGLARSYIHDIPRLMDEAVERAGFLMTAGEQSAGQIRVTAPIPGANHHFYIRNANVNDCAYTYHQFHTIAFTMESGFEESTVVRLRRLLEIGNATWRGERYSGYPVNQVGCWTSMAVSSWGRTAAQRRASRVELWQKLGQLAYGCAHPEPRGSMAAFFITDPGLGRAVASEPALHEVVARLRGFPGKPANFDLDVVAGFFNTIPAQTTAVTGPMTDDSAGEIEHGVVIRLLIPYPDAEPTHVRLDGREMRRSDTDGYQIRHGPGTIVEVAIPPGQVGPIHIVTCRYETAVKRRAGFRPEDW